MDKKPKLLSYPVNPATSALDPNAVLPVCIIRAHEAMLEARGVPLEDIATCSEAVRLQLLIQHWESVIALGAHFYLPFSKQLTQPGRAELVSGIREMDGKRMLAAGRQCAEYNGLPEIDKSWRAIVVAYGND